MVGWRGDNVSPDQEGQACVRDSGFTLNNRRAGLQLNGLQS
jgi:hypothetical protein